jgi:hypothetical protein
LSDDSHCLKMRLALLLREKTMVPSRELDMKETASTSHSKDFQPNDSPIKYDMKCFACGAPTKWPHDICDACQKLSKMDCT